MMKVIVLFIFGFIAAAFTVSCGSAEIGEDSEDMKRFRRASEALTTTEVPPSLPERIRDSIYNGVRTVGSIVRFPSATLTAFFRNFSRTATDTLRRNTTVVLITETPITVASSTAPTKKTPSPTSTTSNTTSIIAN